MPSRLLVTGASGFIGSHLCRRLLHDGYDVVGLSNSGKTYRIDDIKKEIDLNIGDIRNYGYIEQLFEKKIDVVFHLAAHIKEGLGDSDFWGINIQGTNNLVRTAENSGVKRFIYLSTMSVYSSPPSYLPLDETHPTEPKDIYGITKLAGEISCRYTSMDMTIIRAAGVYGKYCRDGCAVEAFTRNALLNQPINIYGDGFQSSDYAYVDDIVNGLILAWQKGKNDIYNLGSGKEIRTIDLAKLIVNLTSSKSKIIVTNNTIEHPFRFYIDITKAQKELGYSSRPLSDGLKKYVECVQKN